MNYLVIPDFPHDVEAFDTLFENYQRLTFGTDSQLVVVFDSFKDMVKYGYQWLLRTCSKAAKTVFFENEKVDIQKLMEEVDCYILLSEQAREDYIEFAYDARKSIRPLEGIIEQWSNTKWSSDTLDMRNQLKEVAENQLFVRYPVDKYLFFIDLTAWGESIICFYFFKAVTEYYNKKIVIINTRVNKGDFWQRCPYVLSVVDASPLIADYLTVNYPVNNLVQVHFFKEVTKYIYSVDMNYSMIDEFRDYFRLPKETVFGKYEFNILPKHKESALSIFHQLNLRKGKTVFLSPNGESFKLLNSNKDFFERLVLKLQELGYDVVTNSAKEIFSGVKNVFLNMEESVYFVGLCGNVVSVETGFVEAMCALNTKDDIKLSILWPNQWDPALKAFDVGWVFNYMPLIKKFGDDFIPALIQKHRLFTEQLWSNNITVHDFQLSESPDDSIIMEILSSMA